MPCGGAQLCKVPAPALQAADRYGRQMRLCQMPVAALTGPWFVYCGYSSVEARAQDRRRRVISGMRNQQRNLQTWLL